MVDRVEGILSFNPIVTLAAGVNSNAKDVIHHDIKQALGGPMVVTARDVGDKWYYAPNNIVTTGGAPLIIFSIDGLSFNVGSSGNPNNQNEPTDSTVMFTDTGAIATNDKVRWIFIKNTGTSDIDGTPTSESVIFQAGSSPSFPDGHCVEIAAGEGYMSRQSVIGCAVSNIFARVVEPTSIDDAGAGTGKVRCTVVAMINDHDVP